METSPSPSAPGLAARNRARRDAQRHIMRLHKTTYFVAQRTAMAHRAMIAQNTLFCERISCGLPRDMRVKRFLLDTPFGVSFPLRHRADASYGAVPLIWRWQACANWRQSRRLAGARRRHILTYSTSISLLSFSILISFISFDFRILHNFSIGISNNTDSL